MKPQILCGELGTDARHLGLYDLHLSLERGVAEPHVEAAAFQGVMDLAGAVGGEHYQRRVLGPDGADLRNSDLEVGEHLQQEGLELFVGAVPPHR